VRRCKESGKGTAFFGLNSHCSADNPEQSYETKIKKHFLGVLRGHSHCDAENHLAHKKEVGHSPVPDFLFTL
jgi:hypothetical protein